jgi:hypothetical protein
LKPLLIGLGVAIPVGFILRAQAPDFEYTDVLALGVATWTVAILSLWAVKIVGSSGDRKLATPQGKYHAFRHPGAEDEEWSQPELCTKYNDLKSLPEEELYQIDPSSHLGMQIQEKFNAQKFEGLSTLAKEAFPDIEDLFMKCRVLFQDGIVRLILAPFGQEERSLLALSHTIRGNARVIVGCERGSTLNVQVGGINSCNK